MERTAEVSTNATLTIPISISNLISEAEYNFYLPNRDRAWSASLESEDGSAQGLSKIEITGAETYTANLIWEPGVENLYFGGESALKVTNLTIRVLRKGSPELFLDVRPNITVKADSEGTCDLHYPTEYNYEGIVETTANEKGQINSLSCSEAYDSLFAGGIIISDLSNPEHASYLGNVNTAKFKLKALRNMILSKGKTQISPKTFDFTTNAVYTSGQRRDK